MSNRSLKLIVHTPREVVLETQVSSLRVPVESGQVGLRARVEPLVLAVEPGLVLVRVGDTYQFVGTAGGLLRCDGRVANLLTPLAVRGDDEGEVISDLDAKLAQPSLEMEARETLGRLQSSILHELRQGQREQVRQVKDVR